MLSNWFGTAASKDVFVKLLSPEVFNWSRNLVKEDIVCRFMNILVNKVEQRACEEKETKGRK